VRWHASGLRGRRKPPPPPTPKYCVGAHAFPFTTPWHEGLLLNIYLPQVRNESRQDTPSNALMAPDTRRCKANMIGETMEFLLRTPPTFTLSSTLHQASKASGRHPSCYPRVGSVQLFSGPLLLCPLAL
jgi:hypothetical protein